MATFTVKNLTFTYPGKTVPALKGVSFHVDMGEMLTVCGQSGSGKSTLLRSLKPILAPHGERSGEILFYGEPIDDMSQKRQAARIGYVLQNPDSQIVTDKVWHELAFGLESLGMDQKTIRLRVAEMASFFGIQSWFHKDVNHLSGGQKQLLNLASVMAMQPDVLILDEPTSQLDPIAAGEFLDTVKKINQELGTTVIITEHRLEEVLPMSDRAIVLDKGCLIAVDTPANVGAILAEKNHPMFMAMPTPLQVYSILYQDGVRRDLPCPVNVREGRNWLTALLRNVELTKTSLPTFPELVRREEPVVSMKDVWFRYERKDTDVIKDLSFEVYKGEMFCLVGGNGTGKSTTLSLASGIRKPYRGSVRIKGKSIEKYKGNELFQGLLGVLPQNPQSLFVEKTVRLDLLEIFEGQAVSREKKMDQVEEVARLLEIEELLDMHPYDLSGGEQQRAALAKVMLLKPEILFLDEPTKGLDNSFKAKFASILKKLQNQEITIFMVSHDVEFCGRNADRCAMFFDGKIITTNTPRIFFSGNSFYTTAANRMSRHIFENAVTVEDVVELVRENLERNDSTDEGSTENDDTDVSEHKSPNDDARQSQMQQLSTEHNVPKHFSNDEAQVLENRWCPPKKLIDISIIVLAALTVLGGFYLFDDKQYFVIGFLLVLYGMVPFFVSFERRKPKAREMVILAVMIAVAVVGRAAFIMIPSFKPILAIIIISGVALGKEAGFLVGAMSAFVSNFLFGQGPWSPWQMIAMAIVGYLAGLLFHRYAGNIKKIPVILFGGIAAFFIYGFIVDLWTILLMAEKPTLEMAMAVYGGALYFNAMHAAATVIFLFLLLKPMVGKLERVKKKYGMTVYN